MKVNQLKAGVALSYTSMGLGFAISIIYTPIMLRLLGQSEYGLYNLVSSVVAYLGLLNFGFGSSYIRYYSRYKGTEDSKNVAKLNGMFLIVFSFLGFIALLAGILLIFYSDIIFGSKITDNELSKAKILLIIMVINIAISFPNIVFNAHITANEKFVFQKTLQIIKIVGNPFVVLPVLFLGYGSIGMAFVTTILNILVEISNIIFCFKRLNIKFTFRNFDLSLMKEMSIFSSFIFINMIIDQINWNVDKFILGRYHGTIIVAVYGLAAQISMYYKSFSSAISNVFIPKIHRIVIVSNNNSELTELFTKVGRIQFIILSAIAIGLIFFGRPFINMWAGSNYDNSYPILLMLLLPLTIPLIQNTGISIQRAKNMHQFRSWIYLLIAVLNIIITIPLAKAYGGFGAAIGTSISLIIGNGFIMNWYYHTKIGLDMKYFWLQIVRFMPSLVFPLLTGIFINIYVNLYKIEYFLFYGSIYLVVFLISMWFLGLNRYEKNLIKKPIANILKI